MSSAPSTTLAFQASLMDALARLQQEQRASASPPVPSVAEAIVRSAPALDDPAWAMEELMRICPRPELWSGSALPESVWAPAGTPQCPFGTEPSDMIH